MKRNLIVVVLIVLTAVAGYFYFTKQKNPFTRNTDIYRAVPVSAPLFLEFSSIKAVPEASAVVQELKNAEIGKEWFSFLQQADSLIEVTEDLPRGLRNNPFLLAYGIAGRNQLVPLFITEFGSGSRKNALENFIQTVYSPENFTYTSREYGKHQIHEITDRANREVFFYSFAEDLLLASSRAIIVEQVIRQLSSQGIQDNPFFLDVVKASETPDVSLYINHNWINSFFAGVLNRSVVEKVDEFGATARFQYTSKVEKFRDLAAWSEFGFQFNGSNLRLSGYSAADDSLNHFLSVFDGQQPVRSRTEEILPLNTSFFCSYSISDKKAFFDRLEDFYMHSPAYYHREERMKRFDRGFRTDIRKMLQSIVKDEVIVAATTIPVNPENKTTYFLVRTENRSDAEEQFQQILTSYAARTNSEANELFSEFAAENATTYRIFRFPFPSLPGLWMGSPFGMAEARFFTFHDDFLVFSNSEQGIQDYLRSRMQGATLANDLSYQQFRKNEESRSNIRVFANVNKAFSLRNEIFSPSLLKQIDDREENIRRFEMVGWQIQNNKGLYKNTVVLGLQTTSGEQAQTTWQSEIGSNILTKPLLVTNHTNPGNREIIFQDVQHNLHLVNHNGLVRWTAQLSGPVMGEIWQVDLYQNGRLQYLFNTREKLYVIDRNGNNVANFPVELKSPATNGVSVFDYDNNRNYRFFVAGEDRKVYVYGSEGKIISGWNFGQSDSQVNKPVQHFRIAGKDYIVFKDQSRIYILDRQGETRVQISEKFSNSNNQLVLNLNGTPKLVATNTGGTVYYLYFDGKVEEKKTARFSDKHFFTVDDLDGNNIPDFVFADGNEITVMDENGKKLFSKKLDRPVTNQPNIYTFAADLKKVGVVDAVSNRIYLFNPDGKLHPGFPLQGNTEFSIGKLAESNTGLSLIVGSEGGKLYHYTLN